VVYRTEGCLDRGAKVHVELEKLDPETLEYVHVESRKTKIEKKWGNTQSVVLTIEESGEYKITASILTRDNRMVDEAWKALREPKIVKE
jgi:hypothetical protein